jgi:glycine cleavage system H protein
MVIPADRLYSEFHFWVLQDSTGVVVGISDQATEELGEVDYVELPEPGEHIVRNRSFGLVETSKALTELVAPISGTVMEANAAVREAPEILMQDPYGTGWLIKIDPSDSLQLRELMTAQRYGDLVTGEH